VYVDSAVSVKMCRGAGYKLILNRFTTTVC
jgi:hypothetical protein